MPIPKIKAEWVNAISAFIVAIFTVFLTWVAVGQWQLMEQMDKATRERERAFIYPELRLMDNRDASGRLQYWRLQIVLVNNGNTQTRNLRWAWDAGVSYHPNPETTEIELHYGQPDGRQGIGYLHPKASVSIADTLIGRASLTPLLAGRQMHVLGRADYEDIYGDKRSTRFCFQLYGGPWDGKPETADAVLDGFALAYRPCAKNNCTDTECPRQ